MAGLAMTSTSLAGVQGLPSLGSPSRRTLVITASGKKIKTKTPYGPSGDLTFKSGIDATGNPGKGKGVYQFGKKYGANVDGYSPIYTPEEWSPNGDVYTGGQTGLLLWAVTLGGVLLAGAFLVYSTSALSQ